MRSNPFTAILGVAATTALLAVGACSYSKPNTTPAEFEGLGSGSAGDASVNRMGGEDSGTIFGIGKNNQGNGGGGMGSGLGVNAYLWRGALDTIAFMPLASADPFGGVIITDWYQPPGANGERFKATIYILSRDLRSDGLRVNIFRQVQAQNGQWVDSPVDITTVSDIENKVLARARRMREQTQTTS
jgi:hypothetical protein